MEKFAIIIPTYKEARNLEILLPLLARKHPGSFIVVVDDNSPDGTTDVVKNLIKKHKNIHLITRLKKSGRGSAVVEGLKYAILQKEILYFLEMDADFSHDPREIKSLLTHARPNTVVIGSRYVPGAKIVNWPFIRKLLSIPANIYTRALLQIPIHDYTNGFRLYPKNAVSEILKHPLIQKGYASLSESAYLLFKKGFSFWEVPTKFVNRKIGHSNTTLTEYITSLFAIIKIRLMYKK